MGKVIPSTSSGSWANYVKEPWMDSVSLPDTAYRKFPRPSETPPSLPEYVTDISSGVSLIQERYKTGDATFQEDDGETCSQKPEETKAKILPSFQVPVPF